MKLLLALTILIALASACGDDDSTTSPSATRSVTPAPAASRTPSPATTLAPTASLAVTPVPTERPPQPIPAGFPIDKDMRLGVVTGPVGSRQLDLR